MKTETARNVSIGVIIGLYLGMFLMSFIVVVRADKTIRAIDGNTYTCSTVED